MPLILGKKHFFDNMTCHLEQNIMHFELVKYWYFCLESKIHLSLLVMLQLNSIFVPESSLLIEDADSILLIRIALFSWIGAQNELDKKAMREKGIKNWLSRGVKGERKRKTASKGPLT